MNTLKIFTNKKLIIVFAAFCCLLWGSAFPAVKIGYTLFGISADDIPSKLLFAGFRFTLSGIIVLLLALITKRNIFTLNRKNVVQLIILGFSQTCLQYIFFYIGLGYTTGVKGSIMSGTGTFFSVIMAHFIYINDKLTLNKILGCLLGFSGVILINFSPDLLKFTFLIKGEGFVMFSAFILSAASIYGKKVSQSLDSMIVTGYQLTIGGIFLLTAGFTNHGIISDFTVASTSLLIYLAVLSAVAFALWAALLKYNKVGEITMYNFLIPVFGVILSSLFLNENIMKIKNLIALIFVCAGIILSNKILWKSYKTCD